MPKCETEKTDLKSSEASSAFMSASELPLAGGGASDEVDEFLLFKFLTSLDDDSSVSIIISHLNKIEINIYLKHTNK